MSADTCPQRIWHSAHELSLKVFDMQCAISATVLLFAISTSAGVPPQSAPASPAWHWFEDCADKTMMAVEVKVDGKSVFKSSFPICKSGSTPANDRNGKQKILAFTFKGGRKFQGEYQTSGEDIVEGNIWQAGADSDDLLLGISFVSRKQNQILLNTIQVAPPDRRSVEEVDPGIFVQTSPIHAK
jgi:hypothetical protein